MIDHAGMKIIGGNEEHGPKIEAIKLREMYVCQSKLHTRNVLHKQ
jgi:hypothetical protein